MNRREVMGSALAALFSAQLANAQQPANKTGSAPVYEHDLPNESLDGWSVTAVEIRYAPGQASKPHRHPGFVLGYILEGEIQFQLAGQEQSTIYRTGEMFYEPAGSIHTVSANASTTKPARMLAMVFAKKGEPRSRPA